MNAFDILLPWVQLFRHRGRVLEAGTHAELLELNGYYASLVAAERHKEL